MDAYKLLTPVYYICVVNSPYKLQTVGVRVQKADTILLGWTKDVIEWYQKINPIRSLPTRTLDPRGECNNPNVVG